MRCAPLEIVVPRQEENCGEFSGAAIVCAGQPIGTLTVYAESICNRKIATGLSRVSRLVSELSANKQRPVAVDRQAACTTLIARYMWVINRHHCQTVN